MGITSIFVRALLLNCIDMEVIFPRKIFLIWKHYFEQMKSHQPHELNKIKFQETFLRKQYNMVPAVFCDCGFYSACPLMNEEKRHVKAF